MGPYQIDMRIIDMTKSELVELIKTALEDKCKEMYLTIESRMNTPEQEHIQQPPLYGIEGLAIALHCSKAKAQRMKNAGMLEGGYKQIGNTIIIEDAQKLRDIAAKESEKEKNRRKGNRVNYSILRNHG